LNIKAGRKTTYVTGNVLLGVAVQLGIRVCCGEPLERNSSGSSVCKTEGRDKLTFQSLWCNYAAPPATIPNIVHTVSYHTLLH
jgi:hypothetical protein